MEVDQATSMSSQQFTVLFVENSDPTGQTSVSLHFVQGTLMLTLMIDLMSV